MNIEEKIRDCNYNLKQINYFNPDPFYVNYFFKAYLQSVIDFYEKIFEEANRDFGLFVSGKCTKEEFEKKAMDKNDKLALRFLSWFEENYENKHCSPYPCFIRKTICFFKEFNHLPEIIIKIRAEPRFENDIFPLIKVGLKNGKIRSREELEIEIKRQSPIFLEIINQKRKNRNEPKISENQIKSSAYLKMKDCEEMEISYSCDVYLSVMRRFLNESRNEIKKLTNWKG